MKTSTQLLQRTILFLLFAFIFQNIEAETVHSIQNGNWSDGTTWDSGTVPQNGDEVIIHHTVTVSSNISEVTQDITVDNGADDEVVFETDGTITSGAYILLGKHTTNANWTGTFTLTGNFVFNVGATMELNGSGIINAGNDILDKFEMNGSTTTLDWSDGIINVAGYAHFLNGTLNISNAVTMNISTAGTRNDAIDNKKILQAVTINFNAGSDKIDFIVKNFNTGTGLEDYTENYSISGGGTVSIKFENDAGATGHDLEIITSQTTMAAINSNIGTGNILNIKSEGDNPLTNTIPSITIGSGSVNLSSWINMTVDDDFLSSSLEDLIIDGIIHIADTLTLNGSGSTNNITGDGQVSAATYNLGSNEIFGVTPTDGNKSAGANWIGGVSSDWADADNWSKKPPSSNTIVFISGLYLDENSPNVPIVNSNDADARSIELSNDGKSITLNVLSSTKLTVSEQGSSGQGGWILLGSGTIFTVDGGEAVIETNLTIDAATVTVENGGILKLGKDLNVESGGTLDLTGNNSSVIVGGAN